MHPTVSEVTERIRDRSSGSRRAYLDTVRRSADGWPPRRSLSCSNLAHGMAACSSSDKESLAGNATPNIGIVSAYDDMLSAHQPYCTYPDLIKCVAAEAGAVAQVAGGVPAMCDGVDAGAGWHGSIALQPRRNRLVDRRRPLAQYVRRGAVSRHLRQNRPGPDDRRARIRTPPGRVRARRPHGFRPAEQGQGTHS